MRHSTSRDSANRHANVLARGQLAQTDDTQLLQQLQITGYSGEVQQTIEYAESYGFSSVPLPPAQGGQGGTGAAGSTGGSGLGAVAGSFGAAAEHFTSLINSGRSHGVTTAVADRRHRVYKKQPGESVVYDDQGQWIYLRRNQILIKVPNGNSHKVQIDQQSQSQASGGSGSSGGAGSGGSGLQQYGQDATQIPQAYAYHSIDKNARTVAHPQLVQHQVTDSSGNVLHSIAIQQSNGIAVNSQQNITRSAKQISDSAQAISHNGPTTVTGTLGISGIASAANFTMTSDVRLKSTVAPFSGVLERALALPLRTFRLHEDGAIDDAGVVTRSETTVSSFGVIAQEVRGLFPEIVTGDETREILHVMESKIGVIALAALQELAGKVTVLEARLAALEGEPQAAVISQCGPRNVDPRCRLSSA